MSNEPFTANYKVIECCDIKKGNLNADTIPYKSSNWHKNRSVKIYVVYFQMFSLNHKMTSFMLTSWKFVSTLCGFWCLRYYRISKSPTLHNNWKQASFYTFSIWNLQKINLKEVDYIEFLECCNNALSLSFFQKTIINFRRTQKNKTKKTLIIKT